MMIVKIFDYVNVDMSIFMYFTHAYTCVHFISTIVFLCFKIINNNVKKIYMIIFLIY